MTDLLAARGLPQPQREAARFYGPMFLLYSVYDGAEDPGTATALLDELMEDDAKEQYADGIVAEAEAKTVMPRMST